MRWSAKWIIAGAGVLPLAGCLLLGSLVRDAADGGRSEGEDTLTAIALPGGWTRGPIHFHQMRTDLSYPTAWDVVFTAPGTAAGTQSAFVNALRGAGWQQCGDGLTCWVKRPYRLTVTVTEPGGSTEYRLDLQYLDRSRALRVPDRLRFEEGQ